MAIWVVGDVQGCYDELATLLDKIKFDPAVDQLWLVGDLVNRGGQSLEVLRLLHQLDRSVTCVLGNHDLHLLASYVGHNPKGRSNPEFARVFAAPDGDELVRWLRFRPLMHVDDDNGYVLVHAGVAPYWDITTARHCAHEVEHVLRSPRYAKFLQKMYGATPARWKPGQTGWRRLRTITNNFTRMRFVDNRGNLSFRHSGAPGSPPAKWQPWFAVANRVAWQHTIVFGHWAALGYYIGDGVIGIDTGCVWNGRLTAIELVTADR